VSVTEPTKVRRCTPGDHHFADQAVTSLTMPPISVFIHDEAINGKTNDGQQTSCMKAVAEPVYSASEASRWSDRGLWIMIRALPVQRDAHALE